MCQAEYVPGMEPDSAIHRREHGIEVQLPFLYRFAPDSRITAIAMDDAAHSDLHEAAQALAALIKRLPRPPLLAIRSAMNHLAQDGKKPWTGPNRVGKTHCDEFSRAFRYLQKESICMCGQIPAALILLILHYMQATGNYRKIAYASSAEVSGDVSRVVGYASVLF